MRAFIKTILGYDPKQEDIEGGVLGVVKAYYGCVESQGRGTLHCHMVIWVEGGLNVDEIRARVLAGDEEFKARLISFLDDAISNTIPIDPTPVPDGQREPHPCATRGIPLPDLSNPSAVPARGHDLHRLVRRCQSHKHTQTCYKYWKGPPHPKECRFDLSADNTRPTTTFTEDGDISLRCLDGLVNNFNATMIEAIRCNMDIKFIGSGGSAKAVLHYITDYISKSQLKAHVAYAALELAVQKLSDYNPDDDDIATRAKRLLQRCAYSMISKQELGAQQVASYTLGLEDHFTSHEFSNLYWTTHERFIDREDPSPECYVKSNSNTPSAQRAGTGSPGDDEDSNGLDTDSDIVDDDELDMVGDDEVGIRVSNDGELTATSSQGADYQMRADESAKVLLQETGSGKRP
ncbi:hypothetical protein PENSPDRAFT_678723 [Peniophora sp. CONT]|nr:hypothetical protein PENSPDRAFT_678723 [Peniophora sp. CONT]